MRRKKKSFSFSSGSGSNSGSGSKSGAYWTPRTSTSSSWHNTPSKLPINCKECDNDDLAWDVFNVLVNIFFSIFVYEVGLYLRRRYDWKYDCCEGNSENDIANTKDEEKLIPNTKNTDNCNMSSSMHTYPIASVSPQSSIKPRFYNGATQQIPTQAFYTPPIYNYAIPTNQINQNQMPMQSSPHFTSLVSPNRNSMYQPYPPR